MPDVVFSAILAVANGIVAVLNARAYGATDETRDLAATIAWAGSTAYWMLRLVMEVKHEGYLRDMRLLGDEKKRGGH